MTRRFWLAAALAAPVVVLDMAAHAGLHPVPPALSAWIQLVLATPVVLWAGSRSSSAPGRPSSTAP